ATRARRLLVVTAAGSDDGEQRPSRFLAELAGEDITAEQVAGSARRWLSLPALTADLRRNASDPAVPAPLRRLAAGQLARLAAAGVRGAHPRQWYQLTTVSGLGPLTDSPLRVSPSVVEKFAQCGLRWLLEVAAGARNEGVARHFGTIIHAAAVLAADGADESAIGVRIDEIWHHLDFGSPWYSERQREQAQAMVEKFLSWHRDHPRDLLATEESFRVRTGDVEVTGRVDRLEGDSDGRAVVVDLKTGSAHPSDTEMDRHPQLGVYQLCVALGAFEHLGLTEPGGAELVQVGKASLKTAVRVQQQRALSEDPEPGWAAELVRTVAAGMAGPLFEARANTGCRNCPVKPCCPVHPEGAQVGS
ncbi:MAG TPA: PD-(D/E)XK nuclease family protein, partial [Streptosporangiaceae bacterium]|nr:PD-(D/E)XK nuclease family protein [Streptosporangiaceae bacterium]